jgi:AcrR family transcriptional regulator
VNNSSTVGHVPEVVKGSRRKAQAAATADRVISSAHSLFVERGYTGTRMSDVAKDAGVAVQTVYFRFHTKAELLQACYARAVLGATDPTVPMEQPELAAVFTATSGTEALRHFARGNGAIASRVGQLDDVIRSALHEPDAVEVRRHSEQLRREGMTTFARHVADRFGLREDRTVTDCVDLLMAFGGAALYRSLVLECGWSQDKYDDWLANTLADQLLPDGSQERPVDGAGPSR